MAFYDPIADKVKQLTPSELKKLADTKLSDLVQREVPRARKRVLELEQRYPSAGLREKAQRLIDEKKHVASMTGGISGVFGLVGLPFDLQCYERDSLRRGLKRRIKGDDPYFQTISLGWGDALKSAFDSLPDLVL